MCEAKCQLWICDTDLRLGEVVDLYCMHPSLELLFDVHLRLRDGLHALVGLMQGFQEVLRSL